MSADKPWLDQTEGPYLDEQGNEIPENTIFPYIHPKFFEEVYVFKMQKKEGETHPRPVYCAVNWSDPKSIDVGDIANVLGGNPLGYHVKVKYQGRFIAVERVDIEGESRPIPTVRGYETSALGPAGGGLPAYESKGGVMSIPGLDPMAQFMFIQQQQRSYEQREDHYRTMQVIAQMMGKQAPGDGASAEVLSEMRKVCGDLRAQNEALNAELSRVRRENLGLSVSNATSQPQGLVGLLNVILEKSPSLIGILRDFVASLPPPTNGAPAAGALTNGAVVLGP